MVQLSHTCGMNHAVMCLLAMVVFAVDIALRTGCSQCRDDALVERQVTERSRVTKRGNICGEKEAVFALEKGYGCLRDWKRTTVP